MYIITYADANVSVLYYVCELLASDLVARCGMYMYVYQLIVCFIFIYFFPWGPWEDRTFVLYGYLQLPLYVLTLVSIVYTCIIYITGML